MHALARDTELAGDLGLADASGEQLAGPQPTGLEPLAFLLCRGAASKGWHGPILTGRAPGAQLRPCQTNTQNPLDASVARNFAIVGWVDELIALAGGTVFLAHGVLGLGPDEVGEIERIRAAFDNESMRSPGSPAASAATAALVGLDDLIRRRCSDVTVLVPTAAETAVAVRLQDPKEGTWRQSLGVPGPTAGRG